MASAGIDLRTLDLEELSLAEKISLLPEEERHAFYDSLSTQEAFDLVWDWEFWARPDQMPPEGDDWRIWYINQGRGGGKTRTGSEWVRKKARECPGSTGVFIGATAADVRDFMVEGKSGILKVAAPYELPDYEPSKRLVTWPNGTIAYCRSAEDPEGLRGPSLDWAWADELAKWTYLQQTWDNLRFAMREGTNPQTVITTTPRNRPLVVSLMGIPAKGIPPKIAGTILAPRSSTYRNAANLAPEFLDEMMSTYHGTRQGRQELDAVLLEDVEGALWSAAMIEADRKPADIDCPLERIVVAVDPAVSAGPDADDHGVIIAGRTATICPICQNKDGQAHFLVLDDHTVHGSPKGWADAVIDAYHLYEADIVVGEVNNGGDLVETNVANVDATVPFKQVRASRGKAIRAEPIVNLYEQHRVHHVGVLEALETEQTLWEPPTAPSGGSDWSPNRLDAIVWALWELAIGARSGRARSNARTLQRGRIG